MDFLIEILKAIILGIIQGITEWLPISSTGHMILVDEFLQLAGGETFVELFLVVVQFGSILAVVLMYFNRLNPFSKRKSISEKKETINLWIKILIACVPAGIIGVLFNDQIKAWFFSRSERAEYFLSMQSIHGVDCIKPKHLTGIIGGITHQKHPIFTDREYFHYSKE